jgi:hypothetical protein
MRQIPTMRQTFRKYRDAMSAAARYERAGHVVDVWWSWEGEGRWVVWVD